MWTLHTFRVHVHTSVYIDAPRFKRRLCRPTTNILVLYHISYWHRADVARSQEEILYFAHYASTVTHDIGHREYRYTR